MAKTASSGCRLYIAMRPAEFAAPADRLANALDGGDVACVLLRGAEAEAPDAGRDRSVPAVWGEDDIAPLIALAQARGVAVLLDGVPEQARRLGADGVEIAADAELYAHARRLLGKDAIIGADCGLSRHEAMVLGELGADYVGFRAHGAEAQQAVVEMVRWWAALFEIPCVGWCSGGLGEARALAEAGADFVACEDFIWRDGEEGALASPQAAVAALNQIFAQCRVKGEERTDA